MQHRMVAHAHVCAESERNAFVDVKDSRILDVGTVAYVDDVVVATHDAVEPDTGGVTEDDGADDHGVVGNVEISARVDTAIAKRIDHGFRVRSVRAGTALAARR